MARTLVALDVGGLEKTNLTWIIIHTVQIDGNVIRRHVSTVS